MIEPLFITDDELLSLTGMPPETLAMLARTERAFPPKHRTMGNKRHWPSVRAYLDHVYGSKVGAFRSKANDAA